MKLRVFFLLSLFTFIPSGNAQTQDSGSDPFFDQDPTLLDTEEKRIQYARDYAKKVLNLDDLLSIPVAPSEVVKKTEEASPPSTRREKRRAAQQLARIIQKDSALLRTGIEDLLHDFNQQLPKPRERFGLIMERAVRSEAIAQRRLKPFSDSALASGNSGTEKAPSRSDSTR